MSREIISFWRDILRNVAGSYRPERHYMRGPGPACARRQRA